jgi:type I restriction-modification system DNA methylase subunit
MSIEAKHVTLSALESHLWESANILRGPVDAADFKSYIFPLLFFKRISDVFDEEVAAALEESGGDQEYALFPENHRGSPAHLMTLIQALTVPIRSNFIISNEAPAPGADQTLLDHTSAA